MKGIIIYQSKYGATAKYAKWLSEETGFECIKTEDANIGEVKDYDVIIFGGGIYASRIAGLEFLENNIQQLDGKKIIVFCDGSSPYDEKLFHGIVELNMKSELSKIPCFYCRGAWMPSKMEFRDRKLCTMLRMTIEKKAPEEREAWEEELAKIWDVDCDWTDKKEIEPILTELRRKTTES